MARTRTEAIGVCQCVTPTLSHWKLLAGKSEEGHLSWETRAIIQRGILGLDPGRPPPARMSKWQTPLLWEPRSRHDTTGMRIADAQRQADV